MHSMMRVNTIIVETMRPAFEQPRLRPSELGQGTVADKFAKCRRHSFDWPEMSRMWILCRDFQFKLQDLVIQLIGFLRRLSQNPSPLAIARQGALTLQWPVVSWLVWVNRVNTKQSKSWLNIPINMNEISMECCMGCPICDDIIRLVSWQEFEGLCGPQTSPCTLHCTTGPDASDFARHTERHCMV